MQYLFKDVESSFFVMSLDVKQDSGKLFIQINPVFVGQTSKLFSVFVAILVLSMIVYGFLWVNENPNNFEGMIFGSIYAILMGGGLIAAAFFILKSKFFIEKNLLNDTYRLGIPFGLFSSEETVNGPLINVLARKVIFSSFNKKTEKYHIILEFKEKKVPMGKMYLFNKNMSDPIVNPDPKTASYYISKEEVEKIAQLLQAKAIFTVKNQIQN